MQSIFSDPTFHLRPKSLYGKTLKWYTSDSLESYKPDNNLYGPDDIEYQFNSCGFRCEEFVESKIRIVFLGCSITEAIGIRSEQGWAYQILEIIRKDIGYEIPYWNLAMGGAGLDAIVRSYYCYYDMLKPHIVFAYLPAYRREIFVPDSPGNVPIFTNVLDNILPKHEVLIDPRNIQYENEKNLALLDLMLRKHDTKMFWNSWGQDQYPKDFHQRHGMSILWDRKGRDKSHPGPDAHHKFAKEMYMQLRSQILDTIKSINSCGS